MKICIVSFYSPQTSAGGLERYLDTIMKELDKRNVEVHFVTASYGKDEVEKVGNITFHKIKAMSLKTRNKNQAAKNFYKYLKKLIKKEKIDVISAENFQRIHPSFIFAVNLASMETKTPVVLRMHNHFKNDFEESLVKDLFWDKVIPVSRNVSSLAYNSGVEINKISTIYPPINTEIFKPGLGKEWLRSRINVGKKDIVLLHASRITGSVKLDGLKEKGVLNLIKAFSLITQHHKNAKLLIATAMPPPSWKKEYEKSIKRIYEIAELNGVKDRVIVQSFKLEEMPLVYNGSDIYVMASRMESFGLVYAEALACEIPVLGTSVGGIPEIIDSGKTGYLTEPDNPVELSKRLELLLHDEKKRKLMGKRGRKIVEKRFGLNKITDNLVGVLNSIVYKKPKPNGTTTKPKEKKKNNKKQEKQEVLL
jgi:L-malate glycosyltransferase